MPANSKYLSNTRQRIGKISAGILAGYFVMVTLHLLLASIFTKRDILISMTYSGFIIWVVLMILAFLFRSAWKVWALYILLSLLFFAMTHFLNN